MVQSCWYIKLTTIFSMDQRRLFNSRTDHFIQSSVNSPFSRSELVLLPSKHLACSHPRVFSCISLAWAPLTLSYFLNTQPPLHSRSRLETRFKWKSLHQQGVEMSWNYPPPLQGSLFQSDRQDLHTRLPAPLAFWFCFPMPPTSLWGLWGRECHLVSPKPPMVLAHSTGL